MATTPPKPAGPGGRKATGGSRRILIAGGVIAVALIAYLFIRSRGATTLAASPSGADASGIPASGAGTADDSAGSGPTPDEGLLAALAGENQQLLTTFLNSSHGFDSLAGTSFGASTSTGSTAVSEPTDSGSSVSAVPATTQESQSFTPTPAFSQSSAFADTTSTAPLAQASTPASAGAEAGALGGQADPTPVAAGADLGAALGEGTTPDQQFVAANNISLGSIVGAQLGEGTNQVHPLAPVAAPKPVSLAGPTTPKQVAARNKRQQA